MKKRKTEKPTSKPRRNRVNVIVVPHGGGANRNIYVHGGVFVALMVVSAAMLAGGAVMVSGYWKNIIDLSHLAFLEQRDREEGGKLEAMERGIGDLEGKLVDIRSQRDGISQGHRLGEVRSAETLLPDTSAAAGPDLGRVEGRVAQLGKYLALVRRRFDADPDGLANVPSVTPAKGWLYRDFGNTVSPFTGRVEMHRGVDIVAPRGTAVIATADGVVTKADLEDHYGLVVELDHGNGYVTRYCHNMRNAAQLGQTVKRGQIIAYVGSTGRSSCTHVHYEVIKDGVPLNPRFFILREPRLPITAKAPPPA